MTTSLLLAMLSIGTAQDKPIDIPKAELPAKAVCAYCVALGTMMTEDKPVSGVRFRGKPYYFHSKSMRDAFLRDPIAYLPPVLPRTMDAFSLVDLTGKKWDDEAFRGKTILVDFWATWCEPCKAMMPMLHELYATRKGKGLDEMLSVSIDTKKRDFDAFVKKTLFPNPVLYDSKKTFNAWHILALPTLFLIKDGQVIAQWSGEIDRSTIEKALDASR